MDKKTFYGNKSRHSRFRLLGEAVEHIINNDIQEVQDLIVIPPR